MIVPRLPKVNLRSFFERIDNFSGGTNTLTNQARSDKKYAIESTNLYQVQDRIWKTRPGTSYYGQAISGATNIDGAYPYLKTDGTEELIAIGDDGVAYKSTDGGSWSSISGATFTGGIKPFFVQINNRLYIANGTDDLTYYDGTSLNTYSALSNPSAPSGAGRTTLTTGSYNNYYRVVAVNDIGYTEPSASLNIATNKSRDAWETGENVYFTMPSVANATGYQIFYGERDGEEVYLGEVATGVSTFTDDGSLQPNPYIETPNDNTTSAPKFRSMEVSGNRIWATYDPNNKYRVYYSGTGQYLGYFSPFYGGGYVDLEKGGRNTPVGVTHYRDGKGNPMITVLCSSPDGQGTIFQLELTSVSIGDTEFTVPASYKIVGSIGADSPYSIVKAGDNVIFANKRGAYALRNKQQIFNVLSSDDLTAPVRNKWEALNGSKVKDIATYYKAPRLYISVAVGSENDTTAIFDLERNNWSWSWSIGYNQFLEYTDSTGITRLLAVPTTGNKLVEITDNANTDLGNAFYQSYISPLIPVDKDKTTKAKVKEAIFELGSLRGTVTCEIVGLQENKQVASLGSVQKSATTGTTGWGSDLFSTTLFGDTGGVPTVFSESTTPIKVRINKKLYAIQFKVYSTTAGTSFEILSLQAKGILQPSRSPSSWA